MPFGTEKLEWLGYQMIKKLKMFIRVDRIHERDRQTHTHRHTHIQTDGHRMMT